MPSSCAPSRLRASTGSAPVGLLLGHLGQIILRQREQHRDRIHLRHHDDAGGVGGVDDVAWIDEANAGHAVDGRLDARVVELQLGVLDRGAIVLHRAGELLDQRALVVDLLLGQEVLPAHRDVAIEIALGAVELRLIARQRRLTLVQQDLERPRIDLGDDLVVLDRLPLAEDDLVEPSVDLTCGR